MDRIQLNEVRNIKIEAFTNYQQKTFSVKQIIFLVLKKKLNIRFVATEKS